MGQNGAMERRAAVVVAAIAFAALTAAVFLVRAGDPGWANWPVTWELRSSDNGVLFQVLQDLFAGRQLDWSFSPQVYVFPELPISFVAYLLAGGGVYAYYLLVAVVNNGLLFLAVTMVLRLLFPGERMPSILARAALASAPLLLLPLIGTSWLVSYPLAPTYYFGMYLMVLAAPALFLVRTRWRRVLLAVAIGLTAASNPLALVFSVPAFALVLLVRGLRMGLRSTLRPAGAVLGILAFALVVRLLLFTPLQGTSPLSYVDPQVFAGRLAVLGPYFDSLARDPSTRVILVLGAILAVVCLVGAVVVAGRYLRRGTLVNDRLLVAVYFGLVPLVGLAGTLALMISHYLYFWLVLIAPFLFVLSALPRGWAQRGLPVGAVALVVAALVTGAVPNLAHGDRYFGYRSPETRCLDGGLPDGAVGYATFSDARRVSLTSARGIRLVQLLSDGAPAYWLTNRSYVRAGPGTFFYINEHGDEPAIDRAFVIRSFGEPDRTFSCGDGQTVLVYDAPQKRAAIARHYGAPVP